MAVHLGDSVDCNLIVPTNVSSLLMTGTMGAAHSTNSTMQDDKVGLGPNNSCLRVILYVHCGLDYIAMYVQ